MRRKQGREIVYVERGGTPPPSGCSGAPLLGAGLALLYAPRSGEETRRVLQRKLWKLRAMTEEKFDELAQQFGGGQGARCPSSTTRTRRTCSSMPEPPAARGARRRVPAPPGRSSSAGWPRRAPVAGPPGTSRSRSPERRRRRVASVARRVPRRTLQAADENNIPFLASALTFDALLAAIPFVLLLLIGLTHLAWRWPQRGRNSTVDPTALFHRFFPPHVSTPGRDPFEVIEKMLVPGQPEPHGALALRHSGLRLVQHPALRRGPDLAERRSSTSRRGRCRDGTSCSTSCSPSCGTPGW